MPVFKAYLKIAGRNKRIILMYLGIFFCVTIMFQEFGKEDAASGYRIQSVPVGVVDEDGGDMAGSLIDYLEDTNQIIILENNREALQEDLFYRNVDYILRIPEDFIRKCIYGDERLKVTTVPGTYAGSYVDQQVNDFINFARCYASAGFSEEEILTAMEERPRAEVSLADFSGNEGEKPAYIFYYRYLPYLFLSVVCYVFGYILIGFHRGSLPGRMRASAVSERRQNLEGLAAAGVLAAGLWVLATGVVFLLYGEVFVAGGKMFYYLLNSLALLVVSLSLSYLIGSMVKDTNALNGVVNIVTLGMCFLCGTFVGMDLLSSKVKQVAQFFPVYWYETVNGLLEGYGSVSGSLRTEVFQGIGIQLMFAAALVCVTLAVSKKKAQKQVGY